MTSTLPPLVQAFSGGIGSASANAISYPLDLIATRLRTTNSKRLKGLRGMLLAVQHILRTEGWGGLYDGLGPDTTANFLSSFFYFLFYTSIRAFVAKRKARLLFLDGTKKNPATILLSAPEEIGIGFLAGVASRSIVSPLNVITVRLQTSDDDDEEVNLATNERREANFASTAKQIYKERGLLGFWKGFGTAIPLSLNPALTMFLFQVFRRLVNIRNRDASKLGSPSPGESFFGAAISNAIATTALYPLLLAKTLLQMQRQEAKGSGNEGEVEKRSTFTIWKKAYEKHGWSGLYQGLEAQIIKGFVNQGLAMMVKSRVELFIFALYVREWQKAHVS